MLPFLGRVSLADVSGVSGDNDNAQRNKKKLVARPAPLHDDTGFQIHDGVDPPDRARTREECARQDEVRRKRQAVHNAINTVTPLSAGERKQQEDLQQALRDDFPDDDGDPFTDTPDPTGRRSVQQELYVQHEESLLHQLYFAYEAFGNELELAKGRNPPFYQEVNGQDKVTNSRQNTVDLLRMYLRLVARVHYLLRAWYTTASVPTAEVRQHMPTSLFFLLSVTTTVLDPRNRGPGKAAPKAAVKDGEREAMQSEGMDQGMLNMLAQTIQGNALNKQTEAFEDDLARLLRAMAATAWRQVRAARAPLPGQGSGVQEIETFYASFETHIQALARLHDRLKGLRELFAQAAPNPPSQRPPDPRGPGGGSGGGGSSRGPSGTA